MVLPGHFQPFRLESEWPYVLLYPLFPCVPVASVVYVVVIDQASPEYPARLDWHLWLDSSSDFRARQQLLASGDSRVCYAIIKDKAAAPLRAYLRDGQWGDRLPMQPWRKICQTQAPGGAGIWQERLATVGMILADTAQTC